MCDSSTEATRLADVVEHVLRVQWNCLRIAEVLMGRGEVGLARQLLANALRHDQSKFWDDGGEFEHLTDISTPFNAEAWEHHVRHNAHHPEYWDPHLGAFLMPDAYLAEMVADWAARSAEKGESVRAWYESAGMARFHIEPGDRVDVKIRDFLEMLDA